MTDRTNYFTVALDKGYRVDDAEVIATAISMIKGVIDVELNVADPMEWLAETRVKRELQIKLAEVLK